MVTDDWLKRLVDPSRDICIPHPAHVEGLRWRALRSCSQATACTSGAASARLELTAVVNSNDTRAIPFKGGVHMRKLILSVLLSVVVMALSIAPAAASSIGPTP